MLKLFVLGDSISIHYGPFLRSYLRGTFEYTRKEGEEEAMLSLDNPQGANGGDSAMVLSFLKAKARCGGIDADLLLLNCGLHDIKTDSRTGRKQVHISQYEENLRAILKTVEDCRTKLFWVRTTLFDDVIHNRCDLGFLRYAGDCIEYNRVADRVMYENGIPVIDLCNFTLNLGGDLYCDHVHFREAVREKQAAYLAGWLAGWLWCEYRQVPRIYSKTDFCAVTDFSEKELVDSWQIITQKGNAKYTNLKHFYQGQIYKILKLIGRKFFFRN
jgi:hypothetical protein